MMFDKKLVESLVLELSRCISGYHGAADDGADLAYGLGCTISGISGVRHTIRSVEHALAARIAGVGSAKYATFTICNVAHPESTDGQVYGYLISAGWNVIAKMPGAHPEYQLGKSPYLSYLMGARTAKTVGELEKLRKSELKLDVHDGEPTEKEKRLLGDQIEPKAAKAKVKRAKA